MSFSNCCIIGNVKGICDLGFNSAQVGDLAGGDSAQEGVVDSLASKRLAIMCHFHHIIMPMPLMVWEQILPLNQMTLCQIEVLKLHNQSFFILESNQTQINPLTFKKNFNLHYKMRHHHSKGGQLILAIQYTNYVKDNVINQS